LRDDFDDEASDEQPARNWLDQIGVVTFACGGQVKIVSVKAWEMMPSDPY
jgi:hypothetical protein